MDLSTAMELDLTRHPVGVLPSTHDHPEASTPTLLPRVGARIGSTRLLVPGVVLTACGTITLVLPLGEVMVLAGAVAFGAGFGILQNATLTLTYARTPEGRYGFVSAIWNAAYDGGMAVGALALGVAGTIGGLAPAFLAIAVVVLATLAVVRYDRRTRSI